MNFGLPGIPDIRLTSQESQEPDWREDHELVSRSPHPARVCLRCKLTECPCCPDYCDASVPEPHGDERDDDVEFSMCPCLESKEGSCVYEHPRSPENEAWIAAWSTPDYVGSEDDEGYFTAWREKAPS